MYTFNESPNWGTLRLIALFSLIAFFFACPDDGPGPVILEPTASSAEIAFFTAWMADCTADTIIIGDSLSGMNTLLSIGQANIDSALTNDQLQKTYGDMGGSASWGPAIAVSQVSGFAGTGTATDNLMFMATYNQGNNITYNIGIAGTNRVTPFGWLTEDLQVQAHVAWDPADSTKGMIAEGSMIGLDILLGLSDNGVGIVDYLKAQVQAAPAGSNITINVAGHSLGGALAPLMALYLREQISDENCQVAAWAYAGPTPGNAEFATYMVNTLKESNYHAYINSLDVVPHAWQVDSLQRLCTIYAELSDTACAGFGGKIIAGSIVPGLANWAIQKATEDNFAYQIAGNPTSFEEGVMPFDSTACAGVNKAFNSMKTFAPSLYADLTQIALTCESVNSESTDTNIHYFLAYMAELGYQHSYPYMAKFIPEDVVEIVEMYAQAGSGASTNALSVESEILHNVIAQVMASTTSADCTCSD